MNTLIEQVKTEIAYRGYSQSTCKSYCEHLLKLSHYFNKPLDSITDEELNAFFNDPAIRKLSRASQKIQINSILKILVKIKIDNTKKKLNLEMLCSNNKNRLLTEK